MKVSLQHNDHSRKIQCFSELAGRLRQAGCAQDRSAVWSPAAKVEKITKRWASEAGFVVSQENDQLVVRL